VRGSGQLLRKIRGCSLDPGHREKFHSDRREEQNKKQGEQQQETGSTNHYEDQGMDRHASKTMEKENS